MLNYNPRGTSFSSIQSEIVLDLAPNPVALSAGELVPSEQIDSGLLKLTVCNV